MIVLDLFSGTGGWSQAFMDRGHHVHRVDNDSRFASVPGTTIMDIRDFQPLPYWHVILASPPCQKFSVGRISRNWAGSKKEPLVPKNKEAVEAMFLVHRTLQIIEHCRPKFWWMENPTGAMRRLEMLEDIPRTQVTFCQYGKHYRKPTDLWGHWPDTWIPRNPCDGHPKNGFVKRLEVEPDGNVIGRTMVLNSLGESCHESAARGAKTGVQGLKDATERGKIPYELSLEVCLACEAAGL